MKPKQQKELRSKILEIIRESGFTSTDLILIDELIDWVVINNRIKDDLQASAKNGELGVHLINSLSCSSKHIVTITKALGLSPAQRKRGTKKKASNNFDLNSFLVNN